MIFDYKVKHNGKYYPAGTDVPVGKQPKEEVEEKEVPTTKPKVESTKKK